MKKVYLKSAALTAMMALSMNAMADVVYVSASGNDANSGASADQALATLNAAVAKAIDGDVIKISGTLKLTETVKLENFGTLTIEGTSADSDGLNGQNAVQLLNVQGTTLTLRNLTLQRGLASGYENARGGALWGRGKTITIDNCVFTRNATEYKREDNGGAIFYSDGTLNITNSEFTRNSGYRGGAVEVQMSTFNCSNTTFDKNFTMANEETAAPVGQANAGALAIGKCTARLTYVTVKNSSSSGRGGAFHIWSDGNATGKSVTLQSCAVLDNEAGAPAGAILLALDANSDTQINLFSCTFSGNNTTGAGGMLCIEQATSNETQAINIVNCTITGNYTANNAGNVGGMFTHGMSKIQAKLNLVNTILEGNYSSQGWSDSRFARGQADAIVSPDYVTVVNSIIGHAFRDANDGELTNVTNSEINTTGQNKDNPLKAGLVEEIIEDCFPLKATSKCLTMGSVEEAAKYGVTRDQKGQLWTRPFIGSVQLQEGDQIPEVPNGIMEITMQDQQPQVREGIYTLDGVRVERAVKGIYIYNGKKIVLK